MAGKTEQQLILSVMGKLDKSLSSTLSTLNNSMDNLKVALNKVYSVSSRLESQLSSLSGKLRQAGQAADSQSSSMTRLSAQTQAYSNAVKKLSAQNVERGIQQGSTAWNEQFAVLNKLEKQLFRTSQTMGLAGNAWYQAQDRFSLLNNTMQNGVNSTNSYLKAIQRVGSYGTVYSNAVKRAAEQYGAGTAQFEAVARGIKNVGDSQAIAAQRSEQLGEAYKKLTSSRQVLSQAEQNAAGVTKMTREGLVAVSSSTEAMSTGMTAAKKGVIDYAKGLKDLGQYGRQYQEAAVAAAKDYGSNSAMYKALYGNIKAVGEEQLKAASRAKTLGTSYNELSSSAQILNEATARHGKVQTEAAAEMSKTVTAASQATGVMGTLQGAVNRVASAFKTMASYAIATSLIAGIYKAVQAVVEYDQALHNLQAISGATDEQMARMGDTLKDVASNSNKGIKEIAGGMTEIAQAGFSASETMQTIGAVTDLATGTMSDMGKSTNLVTTIIRAFNKDASESGEVVDVMAVAINKSKLDVDKLNTAYNYVGVAARQASISFKDATASTMALANAGLRASTIGTGLRQIFQVISQGSGKFTTAILKAGMSLDDFSVKDRSYCEVLENMNTLLQKGANFYDIFGTRAGNAAIQLATSAKQVQDFSIALNEVGAAQQMAQTQMQGLGAKVDLLQNKFHVLMAGLADNGLTSIFGGVLDALNATMTAMAKFADSAVGGLIIKLGALVVAAGLATTAIRLLGAAMSITSLLGFAKGVGAVGASLLGFESAAAAGTAALGALAAVPVWGWIAAGVAAVGGLAYALSDLSDSTSTTIKKQSELATALDKQTTDLGRYKTSISTAKEGSMAWKEQTLRLLQAFPELASTIDVATASTNDYITAINALMQKKATEHTDAMKRAIDADIKMFQDAQNRLKNIGTPQGEQATDSEGNAYASTLAPGGDATSQVNELTKARKEQTIAIQNAAEQLNTLRARSDEASQSLAKTFLATMPKEMADAVLELANNMQKSAEIAKEMASAQGTVNEGLKALDVKGISDKYAELQETMKSGTDAQKEQATLTKGYIDEAVAAYVAANEKINKAVAENKETQAAAVKEERDAKVKALDEIAKAVVEQYNLELEQQKAKNAQALANTEQQIADTQGAGAAANKENNVAWQKQNEDNAQAILAIYTNMVNALRSLFGQAFEMPAIQIIPTVKTAVEGETTAVKAAATAARAHTKALNSMTGAHGDLFKAERKRIANLKSLIELEEAQSRLSVAKGEVAAEDAEITALERKIETAKEYVAVADQMRAKAKSETDVDSAEKEQNSANKELLNLQAQLIEAKKRIAKDGAEAEIALNDSKNNLEISGMNDSFTRYTEIERKKHDAKVASVNAQISEIERELSLEKEGSHARGKLEADLNNKKAELAAENVSYEKQLYAERERYMDDYYAYGIMSATEYMSLLKRKYNEGQISALDYAKKRIEMEGSVYEQMKLGLAEWLSEQKTSGRQVVELVKGTIDDIKSGIGDMVESLIDGSKTGEQAIADMLKNIGKRFLEFSLNNIVSSMFKNIGSAFGFNTNSLLGGLTGSDTATDSATAANTNATTANTFAIGQLTTALATNGLTGATSTGGSIVGALGNAAGATGTAASGTGELTKNMNEDMSDAAAVLSSAGSNVSNFASKSTDTISEWASGVTSIFSSLANGLMSIFSTIVGGSGGGGLFGTLFSGIKSLFSKGGGFYQGGTQFFAHGAAFATGAYAFADGGVFNTPRIFKFAKGGANALGMLGEKGPEAILPLKRDSQGNLGVSSQPSGGSGSSAVNIINVTDPNMVLDALGSTAGQKVVMNIIASNNRTLKRISGA